ncbi:hypothetical protein ACH5RR_034915 [Cinchona calisaya]|uniref:Uncharacterized protein n=1 Tax=Cinchona calisaya TaxID=153742 RepID=A0ABD2YG79_9GENT
MELEWVLVLVLAADSESDGVLEALVQMEKQELSLDSAHLSANCMPLNFLGLGAGGGCGVGVGLGWGFGTAFGSQYRNSRVIFQGIDFDIKNSDKAIESKDLSKSTRKVHTSH